MACPRRFWIGLVVGVLVVAAVVEGLHEFGGGVAEVEGDGLGEGGLEVLLDLAVSFVDGVGFGGEGEVDDGLGEGEVAFGVAEEVHGVAGGEAEVEGFGGGEADVFDGHADDAAGAGTWGLRRRRACGPSQ